jgi:hypothetical protein
MVLCTTWLVNELLYIREMSCAELSYGLAIHATWNWGSPVMAMGWVSNAKEWMIWQSARAKGGAMVSSVEWTSLQCIVGCAWEDWKEAKNGDGEADVSLCRFTATVYDHIMLVAAYGHIISAELLDKYPKPWPWNTWCRDIWCFEPWLPVHNVVFTRIYWKVDPLRYKQNNSCFG